MYTLPVDLVDEIREFGSRINDFRQNKIEPVKFKAIRVPMGIYEQREDGTYMVRVRCPGGLIKPNQLIELARIAKRLKISAVHITTRQELQFHDILLEDTPEILGELYNIGLATRGGGGNTVRNIMGSIDAGIAKNEAFDVTPYVIALTNKLISEPDSWTLPRKFKISFSGSEKDNALAAFNDLGFVAKYREGQKGFKVYIGGSLGVKPMVGHILFEFIPDTELYYVADAVKKLFSRHGNRRNKHKARLRFLFYKLGKEKVFELFREIYEEVKLIGSQEFEFKDLNFATPELKFKKEEVSKNEFAYWKENYVSEQKQEGFFSVIIPFEHGLISPEILLKLGEYFSQFGEDVLRFSMRQNIHVRNIPEDYLNNVFNFINKLGVKTDIPVIVNSIVSCAGADTCRLGICLSRGVSGAIRKELLKVNGNTLDKLNNIRINISGCPNSCGQQGAADLGFYGKVLRNDKMYPAYNIVAGGRIGIDNPKLAELVGEINARDLPSFVIELLTSYANFKDNYKSFADFIETEGKTEIINLCEKYKRIPSFDDDKNYYFDWGGKQVFSLVGKGMGECSAGMFDMIDFDLNSIKKSKEELKNTRSEAGIDRCLRNILFHASRMLLVTRGIEPGNEEDVYCGFIKKFINDGLINDSYKRLIQKVMNNDQVYIKNYKTQIISLAHDVENLYQSMDDTLQFQMDKDTEIKTVETENKKLPRVKKDYRGVVCPVNFVKVKIDLSTMKTDDILEVLLDDGEPIENVPGSVRGEGHKILEQYRIDDYWKVIIQKK